MRFVVAIVCSLMAFLGVTSIRTRIDEEPPYLPVRDGKHNVFYQILEPGKDPRGEREVLSTPIGEFVLSELPNSMTTHELVEARRLGQEQSRMRTIQISGDNGQPAYITFDSGKTSEYEMRQYWNEQEERKRQKTNSI